MRIEDVNTKIRELNIGSYSLIVDRTQDKIVVNSDRGFDNFKFMNFEVVSQTSESSLEELEEFEEFSVPDIEVDLFKE
jgi:hypothetical protein